MLELTAVLCISDLGARSPAVEHQDESHRMDGVREI